MNVDRQLVAQAVLAGQLPEYLLTDAEVVEIIDRSLDVVLEQLSLTNPSVFWGIEDPLPN